MSDLMHLRINKRRVSLLPSSSEHDIYRKAKARAAWPRHHVYFEWEDRSVEILNDDELHFACRVLSEQLLDDWTTDFWQREAKVEAHMNEPDSEDERVTEDEDLTIDDLFNSGFRHEFY